jgi:hypothetical protein
MSFRGVFIAVFLGTALVMAAFALNARRPQKDLRQPGVQFIKATGKCAECHRHETSGMVEEYDMSKHNAAGVTCLACHEPKQGQEGYEHKGFTILRKVTALNCKQCHPDQYEQYARSRHAAPSWAAVTGTADFTPDQVAFAEQYHKGAVDRPANALVELEGPAAITKGCRQCHDIGKPNADGTIGTCTKCHARHAASVELARLPETCGQCHMGPDHSQLEIYHESKHGVLFQAQREHMNLAVPPKDLTAKDMPVPTCSTCHMGGIDGGKVTHDVGERLSYYLFAAVSTNRPGADKKKIEMVSVCTKCHANSSINQFYTEAGKVVRSTNKLVQESDKIMKELRDQNLLTPEPFDEPIEYTHFNLWHYGGRTAKHGAFMGGADFVQWHGFYEVVSRLEELKHQAAEIRDKKKRETDAAASKAAAEAARPAEQPVPAFAQPGGEAHGAAH